jgi:hypothetical protein
MEVLNNEKVKTVLNQKSYFDLNYNDSRLKVILFRETKPTETLKDKLNSLFNRDDNIINHHELQNLLTEASMQEPTLVVKILEELIKERVNILHQVQENDSNEGATFSRSKYMQLHREYQNYGRQVFNFFKNYVSFAIQKTIGLNNSTRKVHLLDLFQSHIFYHQFIGKINQTLNSQDASVNTETMVDFCLNNLLEKVNKAKEVLKNDIKSSNIINEFTESFSKIKQQMMDKCQNDPKYLEKILTVYNSKKTLSTQLSQCKFPPILTSEETELINNQNMDEIIEYIHELQSFIAKEEFLKIDKQVVEYIKQMIRETLSNPIIINLICYHIHQALTSKGNDTDREIDSPEIIEHRRMGKVYYYVGIIKQNITNSKILVYCYKKFLQARMLQRDYDKYKVETDLITNLSQSLGKQESEKMISIIRDVIEYHKIHKYLRNMNLVISSEKYKDLVGISNQVSEPVIIQSNLWNISNNVKLNVNYPKELQCYLDITDKVYDAVNERKFMIEWIPTLGYTVFEATLCGKDIMITCNILQAFALCYANEHSSISLKEFTLETHLSEDLAQKIIESIHDANIFIHDKYNNSIVNIHNYTGAETVDLRKHFIEVFDNEIVDGEHFVEEEFKETKELAKEKVKELSKEETKKLKHTETKKSNSSKPINISGNVKQKAKKFDRLAVKTQKQNEPKRKLSLSDLVVESPHDSD